MGKGQGSVLAVLIIILIVMGAFFFFKDDVAKEEEKTEDIPTVTDVPKDIEFNFFLYGQIYNLSFTVHKSTYDYLKAKSFDKTEFSAEDLVKFGLEDDKQREMVQPLLDSINNLSEYKEHQARMFIRLVQHMPLDETKALGLHKYPYEILYENKGTTGEKSKLLIYLLKELGFGTSIFYNKDHVAAGIKCAEEYGSYCSIEVSKPSIITYKDNRNYELIIVSDGDSLTTIRDEYEDNIRYEALKDLWSKYMTTDYPKEYQEWLELRKKYGFEETSCPKDRYYCNKQCWLGCDYGAFRCTTKGVVCDGGFIKR